MENNDKHYFKKEKHVTFTHKRETNGFVILHSMKFCFYMEVKNIYRYVNQMDFYMASK